MTVYTEADISAAIESVLTWNDLDDVCLALQRQFNIKAGDGAGQHFAGVDWADLPLSDRKASLERWLIDERAMQK
jgi:hypothetical protein